MDVEVTVTVPEFVYDIYAKAAEILGNYSIEQTMSSALQAYAQYLFEEMHANGQLLDDKHQLDTV